MIDLVFIIGTSLLAYYIYLMQILNKGINSIQVQSHSDSINLSFSIIIAARNEEKDIGKLLESLIHLNYDTNLYEVIIINDRSDDRTSEIIETYLKKINGIRLLHQTEISSGLSPKKSALMKGIRESKNEIIITTDADCIVPKEWLKTISSYYNENTQAVAGPVRFVDYPMYRWFMNLQSLDFLSLVSTAAGAIGIGKPVICSGANFSYRKTAFESVGGFKGHLFIASGDDDLLMQSFAKNDFVISYAWDNSAVVQTHPVEKIKGFIEQRKRWGSKAAKYKETIWTTHFYLIFIFYAFLFSLLIGSIFSTYWLELFFVFIGLKALYELPIVFKVISLSEKPILLFFFPLLAILQVPYIVITGILANMTSYSWK